VHGHYVSDLSCDQLICHVVTRCEPRTAAFGGNGSEDGWTNQRANNTLKDANGLGQYNVRSSLFLSTHSTVLIMPECFNWSFKISNTKSLSHYKAYQQSNNHVIFITTLTCLLGLNSDIIIIRRISQ